MLWVIWVGLALMLLGSLGFLIAAFKTHILWGLGCLFLPIVPLVFCIMHWQAAKNPILLQLAGLVLIVIAIAAGGHFESFTALQRHESAPIQRTMSL